MTHIAAASCCVMTWPTEGSTWTQTVRQRVLSSHLNKGFGPDPGPDSQDGTGSSLQQLHIALQCPALHCVARLQGTNTIVKCTAEASCSTTSFKSDFTERHWQTRTVWCSYFCIFTKQSNYPSIWLWTTYCLLNVLLKAPHVSIYLEENLQS